MAIIKRAIYCTPTIGGVVVNDWLSCRLSFQLEQGVAKASIVSARAHGDYDQAVTVAIGADPGTCSGGTAPPIRFSGKRRDVVPSLTPRAVVHECIGTLGAAAEYMNGEDPIGISGMRVQDLVPGGLGPGGSATAAQIIGAVLTKSGVGYSAGDIGSTGRYYGLQVEQFIWKAGTHSGLDVGQILLPTEAGETALDYIHRYDQIDAVATPLPSFVTPWVAATTGGFYRTFESLAGRVYRVLIGGRPSGAYATTTFPVSGTTDARLAADTHVTVTGGTWPAVPFYAKVRETGEQVQVTALGAPWTITRAQNGTAAAPFSAGSHMDWIAQHAFTENVNILTGDFRRAYPQADYVLIKGANWVPEIARRAGVTPPVNLGPVNFTEQSSNPFMLGRIVYDRNPPSSDMIEWDTYQHYLAAAVPFGMDCQTVARARMLQVNRIIVSGTLSTPEDWLVGPGQTVLVQGDWGETGLRIGTFSNIQMPQGAIGLGQADRLLTGEPLWVQGVDYEVSHGAGGAPVLRTTITLMGGGVADPGNPTPPPIQ